MIGIDYAGDAQIAKKALLDHPVPEIMWPDLHAIKDDYVLSNFVVKEGGACVPVLEYNSVLVGSLVKLKFCILVKEDIGVEASLEEIEVLYRTTE